MMSNRFGAFCFINSDADVCPADIHSYSEAHKDNYNRPPPCLPKSTTKVGISMKKHHYGFGGGAWRIVGIAGQLTALINTAIIIL